MTDNRSFFEKAMSIVRGRAHDAVDKQLNTVAGCRQAIREANEQLADLRAGLAEANGTIAGYERNLREIADARAKKQADFELLARNGNLDAAKSLSADLQSLTNREQQIMELKVQMEERRDKMQQVVENLEAELREANDQLQQLVVAEASAKSASTAAEAIERAGAAAGRIGSMDTSGAREQILHKTEVADALLDAAIATMGGTADSPARLAEELRVDAAFAEQMRALGLKPDGTPLAQSPQDATS